MTGDVGYTPPLGLSLLTPFYDRAIAALTREGVWRKRLVHHLSAKPGETILDVGAGTGTLAILVTTEEPRCSYWAVDPDARAVAVARRKAALAGSRADFEVRRFLGRPSSISQQVDKIVCSLVLHQVPLAEKGLLLRSMFEWLKPGGQLFVADYGAQQGSAMRLAFRLTVQLIDGKSDTQPNADGVLPMLIAKAGFEKLVTLDAIRTPTGLIDVMRARRPIEYRRNQ